MAEVRPLRALRYDLAAVSSLGDVVSPPYDVIDAGLRRELLERSPFNVVEVDLPEAPDGEDPYEHAAEVLEEWTLGGVLTSDRDEAVWPMTQEYTAPDGSRRTRHGILVRVRVTEYGPGKVRPHERTQPGPKEDRLRLTRATRHNLSPIFSLYAGDAWSPVADAVSEEAPWGEVTDDDGTMHRVWRVADPEVLEAVTAALADSELLIADGHHRYETARTYADEVGGEGPHRYTLMCLVSLDDPGLTVFPTHRLLTGLDPSQYEPLGQGLKELFEIDEVPLDSLDPTGEEGTGVFGYADSHFKRGFRLRLPDTAKLDELLAGRPEAYRRLDAVILETLVLKGILGMSEEDIAAKRGIAYSKGTADAIAQVESESADCAFLLRPAPVEQVREVAAAEETMPPKSTYFFPKVLTGLGFNPLS
jgi:uncharacterized protein (DUF1015 family)